MSKLEILARRLDQALMDARQARLACIDLPYYERDFALTAAAAAASRAQVLRLEYREAVLGRLA
jgi:hypothetical protein